MSNQSFKYAHDIDNVEEGDVVHNYGLGLVDWSLTGRLISLQNLKTFVYGHPVESRWNLIPPLRECVIWDSW